METRMETRTADFLTLEKTTRERGLRVVAIGGGTGLSTLLKGLKRFALTPAEVTVAPPGSPVIRDLCAVVTVSDDGGSSGRLRKELNMLPPGDIRNCIVALSEDEALLSQLFRHPRFLRSCSPVIGDSGHPRPHLSRHHFEYRTGSSDGGRRPCPRRDQDHRQQRPHPGTFSRS